MDASMTEILIAEDNEDDLHLTLRGLARYRRSLQPRVFANGAAILEHLRLPRLQPVSSASPALILLDIKMPLMSGLEVLQRTREEKLCPATPIVMFTSSREPRDISLAYEYGANSFVMKPGWFEPYMETMRRIATYWMDTHLPLASGF